MSRTTSGHLLIADISGYTRYLTSSELEHAQQVLSSLMELLIDRTLPPLRIAGLQGDAVFSYSIAAGELGGQALVEMIEETYVAFRRAIGQMVINTTCQCSACANISALDLKFFIHYGTFSISPLRGKDELIGPAVIEIHRLLKNTIPEATGVRAYAAYTSQAADALRLEGFTATLTRHVEEYPDLAPITVWIQDLHAAWESRRDNPKLRIAPQDALVRVEDELPVPLGVAWEILLQPRYRSILFGLDRQDPTRRQRGRIAEGTVYTCYHGTGIVSTQTVLAWRPFDHMVTEDTTPIPGARILDEIQLHPNGASTALTITCGKARGPWVSRSVNDMIGRRFLGPRIRNGLAALRETVEQELADGTLQIVEPNPSVAPEAQATVADGQAPRPGSPTDEASAD